MLSMEYFVQVVMKPGEINDDAKELAKQARCSMTYKCVYFLFRSVNKHLELVEG